MLLDNFYNVTSQDTAGLTSWRVACTLNPEHRIYNGHFPQQPVLPGVCTLQLIKECAEKVLNHSVRYAQISSCKFLSPVDPRKDQELELDLTIQEHAEGHMVLQAEGKTTGQNSFIKLKARLVKQ